jgi:hypothetical protein
MHCVIIHVVDGVVAEDVQPFQIRKWREIHQSHIDGGLDTYSCHVSKTPRLTNKQISVSSFRADMVLVALQVPNTRRYTDEFETFEISHAC